MNVTLGDIVIYHPDNRLPEFHDKGSQPELPAIVCKVWDATVDLRVMLDSTCNPPFVLGSKYSEGCEPDTWHFKR